MSRYWNIFFLIWKYRKKSKICITSAFFGNPIFENKKGADEPTKAEVKKYE